VLAAFVADGAALVEFGSGASAKTRVILDASPQIDVYIPIDISGNGAGSAVLPPCATAHLRRRSWP
jgi:uncharacterized SAM-dependent methyltransferase